MHKQEETSDIHLKLSCLATVTKGMFQYSVLGLLLQAGNAEHKEGVMDPTKC